MSAADLQWQRVRRRRRGRLQRIRPRRRGAVRVCAAAGLRRQARPGPRRCPPTTNCSPAPRTWATSTSNATSTNCAATGGRQNVVVIGRPAVHRRGPDRGRRGHARRRRAPRAGHLPGRDVRRPLRRLRRLPGARRRRRRYRLRDTKLARSVKVEALLQLAAYADTLAEPGVPVAAEVELVLGDGAVRATASTNCCRCTCRAGPRCSACSTGTSPAAVPVAWEDDGVRACFRCAECERPGPRARRPAAGRRHAGQPARPADRRRASPPCTSWPGTAARCPNCPTRTVKALTAQARLQVADRVDGKPPYEVVDPQPLMVLPDAEQGRPVLRLRGRPAVDGRRPRVGAGVPVGRARPAPTSSPRTGRTTAPSERQALVDFLAMVRKRLQALSRHAHLPLRGLREEHAAAAGRPLRRRRGRRRRHCCATACSSTCIRWCARAFGSAPRTTASSRSSRSTWATSCAAARSPPPPTRSPQYARYCALRDEGRADEAATVLKEIEDYNRYDCRSTRRLRDWLMARAIESGVPPRGPQPVRRRRTPSSPPTHSSDELLEVRRRRHRGTHRRADRRRDGRGRARVPQARGQAVLVGPLRPASTIPSTNGRTTPTSSSPRHAEVVADWHQPPKARESRSGTSGSSASWPTASSTRRCTRCTTRRAPPGLTDDPDRRAFGTVDGRSSATTRRRPPRSW